MKYYKIIHTETGMVMCYVNCPDNNGADDVCEILGKNEYSSEEISKEEYEIATGELEGGDE